MEREVGHIEESLDRAIAKTADAEFKRLQKGLNSQEVAGNIHTALLELGKLSGPGPEMPDYSNKWVPLLYTTWYQPRQVNLVYSLIRKVMIQQEGSLTQNTDGSLYIVDFGCGALATKVGLTLAVAYALKKGQNISRVEVYGIDGSQPMIDMGERLWEEWGEEVTDANLRNAYNLVSSENAALPRDAAGWASNRIPEDGDHWLVALHVSYPANATKVRGYLKEIDAQIKPNVGIVTSNSDYSVRRVWPFGRVGVGRRVVSPPEPVLRGDCKENTKWRRSLLTTYRAYLTDLDKKTDEVSRYLNGTVKYDQNWRDLRCLLHLL